MDFGIAKFQAESMGTRVENALTSAALGMGGSVRGLLFFKDIPQSMPFELEFSEPSHTVLAVDLLPALPEVTVE
jgi:hypothetical protein